MTAEVLRLPVRPRPKLVSARDATFASIERHAVKAMEDNQASLMCLRVLRSFPDDAVSGAARAALVELSQMVVAEPCDCEPPTNGDAA